MHNGPVVVTHGGAGGSPDWRDGCERAAEAGWAAMGGGGSALEAAIEATVVLEDDPRMNAGTGSNFRLDGKTIEMDAAVADHRLRFGAVAAVQMVQNPVRAARLVMDTPHLLLCGEGATRFAHARGLPSFYPVSERARERFARIRRFFAGEPALEAESWRGVDPSRFWNLPTPLREALGEIAGPGDTVGAVARDSSGGFGAGLSTGGTSIMLLGRVGDTPILGAGLYAGPAGAVAATGDGEEIIRRLLAKQVYDWIEAGSPVGEAVDRGVGLVPRAFGVGLIAVSRTGQGGASNRTMPWSVREG